MEEIDAVRRRRAIRNEVGTRPIRPLPPTSRIDVDRLEIPAAGGKHREGVPGGHAEAHAAGDMPDEVDSRWSGPADAGPGEIHFHGTRKSRETTPHDDAGTIAAPCR